MACVRKVESLTIGVQNVVPQLAESPINNVVVMLAAGNPAVLGSEYTVSGQTVTWDEVAAGYNLDVGEVATVDYEYEDGTNGGQPYDPSDSEMNQGLISYNMGVIVQNLIPKLSHVPVFSTLVVKVNNVVVTSGIDWTQSGKVLTWISGTTLSVNDTVYVEYRKLV